MSEARLESSDGGRIRVIGELTFATVSQLLREERLLEEDSGVLRIDLAEVGRADSAGLALLIHWLRHARQSGREVVFSNVPEQMLAIARVSDLENILPREG